MKQTLDFLADLSLHNDRDWFTAHKSIYDDCRKRFETFTGELINRFSKFDPLLSSLTYKDCVWRIYRDVRFSADKRPYKEWFGTFLAAPAPGRPNTGGKRSQRGGYYVHIQPGHCMFAAGMWGPSPELLKVLRQEIQANEDEVEEIMGKKSWKKYFTDFDTEWMLKKVPAGFSPDDPHSDWLKRKAYTVSAGLTDEQVCSRDFIDIVADMALAAKPMNDFLNYTFEEYGEFPDRCR